MTGYKTPIERLINLETDLIDFGIIKSCLLELRGNINGILKNQIELSDRLTIIEKGIPNIPDINNIKERLETIEHIMDVPIEINMNEKDENIIPITEQENTLDMFWQMFRTIEVEYCQEDKTLNRHMVEQVYTLYNRIRKTNMKPFWK